MLEKQIRFARAVAKFVEEHATYELLPRPVSDSYEKRIFIIVLFRAVDEALNRELVKRINASFRMYVSGTTWHGEPACRIAVSNWQVEIERDLEIVREVLEQVADDWAAKG